MNDNSFIAKKFSEIDDMIQAVRRRAYAKTDIAGLSARCRVDLIALAAEQKEGLDPKSKLGKRVSELYEKVAYDFMHVPHKVIVDETHDIVDEFYHLVRLIKWGAANEDQEGEDEGAD